MEFTSKSFLEVHFKSGARIAINPKTITRIQEYQDGGCCIYLANGEELESEDMQEGYEQIIDLLNQLKPL